MLAEILRSHLCGKPVVLHNAAGLVIHMRKYYGHAGLLASVDKAVKSLHCRCVYGRHATHPDDQHLCKILYGDARNEVRNAKEHGACDLINAHFLRNFTKVNGIRVILTLVKRIFPAVDLGLLAHSLHEKHACEHHTDTYCNNKVKYYSEYECQHQHKDIALRCLFAKCGKVPPSAHVISYNKQNGCNGRHGDICGVRHQHHKHDHQHNGMHHSGDGCATAVLYVCGCTCDGACCGNTAKQHGSDVPYTLSHKLHI